MKLSVNQGINSFSTDIYLINDGPQVMNFYNFDRDGSCTITDVVKNNAIYETKPAMRLSPLEYEQFIQAVLDHVKDRGIKHKNDHYKDGELSATKKHLEDMRTLVLKD